MIPSTCAGDWGKLVAAYSVHGIVCILCDVPWTLSTLLLHLLFTTIYTGWGVSDTYITLSTRVLICIVAAGIAFTVSPHVDLTVKLHACCATGMVYCVVACLGQRYTVPVALQLSELCCIR